MNLKVLLPTEVLLEEEAGKVTAEAENGSFTLLPNHIDFVTALAPGLFSYEDGQGQEWFLAVNEGILVKSGDEVLVSVRDAVRGGELGELSRIVEERFMHLDEREKTARTAMAQIEAGFVRRFLEIQKRV
ncbi:MAG: F0F1 ATP synthase subunit epsilon [Deltaproteobacteria bacterium]|nr:F0F1 ATP synthase subunit epsilon [Deltaproteobacteria bacterium]